MFILIVLDNEVAKIIYKMNNKMDKIGIKKIGFESFVDEEGGGGL